MRFGMFVFARNEFHCNMVFFYKQFVKCILILICQKQIISIFMVFLEIDKNDFTCGFKAT